MAHECAWSFSQGIAILIFVSLQLGGKFSVLEGVTDNIRIILAWKRCSILGFAFFSTQISLIFDQD